ncbi:hypothetical protein GJ496_003114, partial [Pomphorhynchus laevis]
MLHQSRFEPCQVCGEQSSGLHCNAVTCEACKKFFLRSIHGEHKKYKCARNKDCTVTRNTRTQCQYCRFNKCLSVGMSAKADDTQTPTVIDLFKQISCYVCGAPSSGIHFGAITCEGCKGFFRRSIKERAPSRYRCQESGICDVNVVTRNGCKHCRFQKCLKVGMSVDASRIGRQSNLFKHHIMMMQKNGQIPSTVLHAMSNNPTAIRRIKKRPADSNSSDENPERSISPIKYEDKLSESQRNQLNMINQAYKMHLETLPVFPQHRSNTWLAAMDQLRAYATGCVKFANEIKGFSSFPNVDQRLFIRASIHVLIIICLSRGKHALTWNYMNCASSVDYNKIHQLLPSLDNVCSENETAELLKWIDRLFLDSREFSMVLAIIIISAANRKLVTYESIDNIQTELTLILLEYMDEKRGERCRDFYTMMLIIPRLRILNEMFQRELINDVANHPEMSYPTFFWKVFVGKD